MDGMKSVIAMPGIDDVVQGGYCSGCGACSVMSGRCMTVNAFGEYIPDLEVPGDGDSVVCPFLMPDLNEDVLADIFLTARDRKTTELGYFDSVFAAHVVEGTFRSEGSSGGIGSWLGVELIRKGMIDAVIHVKPAVRSGERTPFFEYCISRTEESIRSGAHSHYHVVEISNVMRHVRENDGRYLFVGVPCFAKAVRRLQLHDDKIRQRIRFVASLVCGHMKSINWSLSLGWAAGIPPENQSQIMFRIKSEGISSKAYYYGVKQISDDDKLLILDSATVVGGKFNLGAMMLNACNYCDDVVGETADVSIGDAWLPKYAFDWRGKNMFVSRNYEITELLKSAQAQGRLELDTMTPEEAGKAQAGGFRQRREGLVFRIKQKHVQGEWCPVKREFPILPPAKLPRQMIYRLRQKCARESRIAFCAALEENDFAIYLRRMRLVFKLLRLSEIVLSSTQIISTRIQYLVTKWRKRL